MGLITHGHSHLRCQIVDLDNLQTLLRLARSQVLNVRNIIRNHGNFTANKKTNCISSNYNILEWHSMGLAASAQFQVTCYTRKQISHDQSHQNLGPGRFEVYNESLPTFAKTSARCTRCRLPRGKFFRQLGIGQSIFCDPKWLPKMTSVRDTLYIFILYTYFPPFLALKILK